MDSLGKERRKTWEMKPLRWVRTSPTLTWEATERSCKLQLVGYTPVLCWTIMPSNAGAMEAMVNLVLGTLKPSVMMRMKWETIS